ERDVVVFRVAPDAGDLAGAFARATRHRVAPTARPVSRLGVVAVGAGERVDGRLQRSLQRCLAGSEAALPAVALRVRVLGRADSLQQRALQVPLPAAVVRGTLRARNVIDRVDAGELRILG